MAQANIKAVLTAEDRASASLKGFSRNVENSANDFSDNMKKAGAVLAGVGVALTAFAKNSTDTLTNMVKNAKDLARETGTTETEASRLLYVTRRMGIESEGASTAFGILSKKIVENNEVTGETALKQEDLRNKIEQTRAKITQTTAEIQKHGDANGNLGRKIQSLNTDLKQYQDELNSTEGPLNKIGVATKNADGSTRAFDQVLLEVADKFKSMPNGAEKTALAMELFGRSGKDLIPVLNLGKDGIQQLEQNADKLGITLSEKTIGSVNAYIQSQKNLKDTTDSIKISVGLLTAPVLTDFNNKLSEVILKVSQTDGPFKGMLANILAFGGPITTTIGALLAFGANATTAAQGAAAIWSWAAASSAGAWVVARVSMIAGAIATLATHVAVAVASEAAWVGAAIRAAGSWVANLAVVRGAAIATSAVIAAPMVMPALVVAAALASIGLVYAAIMSVMGALDAMNAKARAAESAARSAEAVHARLQGLLLSNDPAQRDRAQKAINSGLATGTSFATGGMTLVGERGPEYVNIPRGSQVFQADQTKRMGGGGDQINITVQAQAFMGTQQEARKFAEYIMKAWQDLQASRGVRV